jgi:hypothetical protein
LNLAPTEYKSRSSHCRDCVGIKYEYILCFYREQNLVKLKYKHARLNIASILLNAAVAVFKLSQISCFVQTAFSVWVCTVIHHEKWNVFLLLTVLFDITCFCVIMQGMLLYSVILWRNSKECCLFGCDTLLVGRNLPTYVRNFAAPTLL